MTASPPTDHFTLDIPAVAEHVATARIFAGSVSRRLEMGEDVVADVKLAVSEACTLAISGGAARLRVAAERRADRVHWQIGPVGADPMAGEGVPAPLDVIEALFAGAALVGAHLEFAVPVADA